MKGWVYVITNKAMPGLVKIGYSTKDPELRAQELNHTGSPHPYQVEYEVLIEDPFQLEQKAHKLLASMREAKEWFRCSPEEAVASIKAIVGNQAISETYKRVEKAKAEVLHKKKLQEREEQLKQQQAERKIEDLLSSEESDIRQKYQQQFEAIFPIRPFWKYWLGVSILALVPVSMMFPKVSDVGAFMLAAIGGAIIATFVQDYFEKERKKSSEYLALEKQRDAEYEAVRSRVIPCPRCGKRLRFDRAVLLLSKPGLAWNCPSCKTAISPPQVEKSEFSGQLKSASTNTVGRQCPTCGHRVTVNSGQIDFKCLNCGTGFRY